MNRNETLEDYVARLNIEGSRDIWEKNIEKIDYVLNKTSDLLKPEFHVAEVGLGNGYLLSRLINMVNNVTGMDISSYLTEKLSKTIKSVNYICGDITKLDLTADTYNVFYCLDILEHIEDLDKGLLNIKKLLKKEGFLIGTLPLNENLENNMVNCPSCNHRFHKIGHFHSFQNKSDIEAYLKDDFTILRYMEVQPFKIHKISKRIKIFIKKLINKKSDKRYKTMLFIARVNK